MNWPEQVLVMSECIIVWAGARVVLKLPVICCKRLLMSFRWAALGEAGGRKIEKSLTLNCTLYFVSLFIQPAREARGPKGPAR